jgi:hypothetical protein
MMKPTLLGLRPQDVFATSVYTGTGAAQTITNGLNLAGQGGLTWIKCRSNVFSHALADTARGPTKQLYSDLTNAEVSYSDELTAFTSNGFALGAGGTGGYVNLSGRTYAAWSFRRAAKFFDIVTYTGDGTSGRQIPHGLGIAPGMIILKRLDNTTVWNVAHRSLASGQVLYLNSTSAVQNDNTVLIGNATSFTVNFDASSNVGGGKYVAYLFAHDPDTTNGIIQCGSAAQSGGADAVVNLGWRPQFVLVKCINSSTTFDNWHMVDSARGFGANSGAAGTGSPNPGLDANRSAAESSLYIGSLANGFNINDTNGGNYIYLAIRAPI